MCTSSAPGDGEVIFCDESDAVNNTIDLNLNGVDIVNERGGQFGHGIQVDSFGDVTRTNISFINGSITTDGDGIQVLKQDFGGGTGTITVDVKDSIFRTADRAISVETDQSAGVGNPNVKISASRTKITTEDALQGAVFGWKHGSGSGNVIIDLDDTDVTNGEETPTGTSNAHGVSGVIGTYGDTVAMGDIDIDISGGTIKTTTPGSSGVYAEHFATGDIDITVENAMVTTTGGLSSDPIESVGIYGWHYGGGNTDISLTNTTVSTVGDQSYGVWSRVEDPDNATPQAASDVHISATGGAITTRGILAHGVYGYMISPSADTLKIELNNVEIRTDGTADHSEHNYNLSAGIYGLSLGTGNLDIDAWGGSVTTQGRLSYGIYARHHGSGEVVRVRTHDGHEITTTGPSGHGIVGYHFGTGDTRTIDITVGGPVTVSGTGAQGVRVGAVISDVPERMATLDDEGYRRQTVRVDSSISSQGPGIYLTNGGRVVIGPQGSIDSASGIAILATGTVPEDNFNAVAAILPKLRVDLNLGGRQVRQAIGDNRIVNDGGETTIAMNNVVLYDGARGATGNTAPNGVWDVRVRKEGVAASRDFSAQDFTESEVRCPQGQIGFPNCMPFVEEYAPRSALYETLPDVLLRLQHRDAVRASRSRPERPGWVRVTGRTGNQDFERSTVGAEYDLDYFEVEVGKHVLLDNGLDAWMALHYLDGTAEVSSPVKGGDIDVQGLGVSLELCRGCEDGDWYASGRIALARYDLDLTSDSRGRLQSGVDATAWGLRLEAGRHLQRGGIQLTPRIRLTHANVSVDRFTDAVEARVSYPDEDRFAVALGVLAKSASETEGGPALWGSLDFEHRPGDVQTTARVSGERLEARPETDSLLFGAGGTWRRGDLEIHASLSAREELGSGGEEYGVTLGLDLQF